MLFSNDVKFPARIFNSYQIIVQTIATQGYIENCNIQGIPEQLLEGNETPGNESIEYYQERIQGLNDFIYKFPGDSIFKPKLIASKISDIYQFFSDFRHEVLSLYEHSTDYLLLLNTLEQISQYLNNNQTIDNFPYSNSLQIAIAAISVFIRDNPAFPKRDQALLHISDLTQILAAFNSITEACFLSNQLKYALYSHITQLHSILENLKRKRSNALNKSI